MARCCNPFRLPEGAHSGVIRQRAVGATLVVARTLQLPGLRTACPAITSAEQKGDHKGRPKGRPYIILTAVRTASG